MRRIAIFGTGGHGREVLQLLRDINSVAGRSPVWQVEGFVVDPGFAQVGERVNGQPVLGGLDWLAREHDVAVVVALGAPRARQIVVRRIEASCGARFTTLVHPLASIAEGVPLPPGVTVFSGSIISVNVSVGSHVHLNSLCSVSHDGRLGDFATLGPGSRMAGGGCLGEGAELGASATLIPNVRVGAWSMVGAGAVVVHDTPDFGVVAGVPARWLRSLAPPVLCAPGQPGADLHP